MSPLINVKFILQEVIENQVSLPPLLSGRP